MWYIVKTDFYKEREAISDLLLLDGIDDIYFPYSRQELSKADQAEANVCFRPIISGVLFIYASDAKKLLGHLNDSGYFLRDDDKQSGTESMHKREQVKGNAHLFSFSSEPESLQDMLLHAMITDEEIYRYKVCVEQCAAHTDDVQIVNNDFAEMVSENDIVMITDGPFQGFTGVIKQVKTSGVKDRCFFFNFGNSCVRISGIRRYGVIVVREAAKGTKAQLPNTWRYIDFLIGKLQASYFADGASAALRHILEVYNRVKDVEASQSQLLREARSLRDEAVSREVALMAVWLQQMDDEELGALKSLSRFFQSEDNSVATSLAELIPDMPLRPFLTPTSGVDLLKGKNFVLFPHKRFAELIFRVNLKEEFLRSEKYPSQVIADKQEGRYTEDGKLKGKMRKARPFHLSNKEYVYYVHIGLWDKEDGTGVRAMVNWGGFLHRYLQLTPQEREAFLQDLQSKGYEKTLALLKQGEMQDASPTQAGFVAFLPDIDMATLQTEYDRLLRGREFTPPLPLLRKLVPVAQLVRRCVPAAVEFWQRQRLLEWRHLVQRYVLLHNLPLD